MTKDVFSEFYDMFTKLVKQEVAGAYVMNASAGFVNYCGGYELVLRPSCIMWGPEIALLSALCEKYCLSCVINLQLGSINVY